VVAPEVTSRPPRPPRRPPTVFTPSGPGAKVYEAPPRTANVGRDPSLGELEQGLLKVVAEAARKLGRPPLVIDPRLNRLTADIAANSRGMRAPPSEVVHFLANHQGVIEPDPAIYTLVGPANVPGVLEQYRRSVGRVFERGAWNRVGVGSHPRGDEVTVVVTLWEQFLELAPVPRELPSEGSAAIKVRLLAAFSNPQIVVTMPGGFVRALPTVAGQGGALNADLRCGSGDGRYQVEVLASGKSGPLVLANFPVFCGVRAPSDLSAYEEDETEDLDPADAEQELFALINQARLAAGLRELVWDNRLAAIARSHSRDMQAHNFVEHISPTTGDALARIKKAGLSFPLVVENVGSEVGVQQAHRGFMSSPGHRANIVNRHLTRVGIGVVVKKGGGAPLLVTELFAAD
jgi:uncharacterized protein YkwD